MMAVMAAQPPLPVAPVPGVGIGPAVLLVEDADGGRVFLHGNLIHAWDAGDEAGRRLAAVQLVECGAASATQVAAGFGVGPVTVWRWRRARAASGTTGLAPGKTGPKGPSKVTDEVAAQMGARRAAGETLEQIATAFGVSEFAVRQGLKRLTTPSWLVCEPVADDRVLDAVGDPAARGAGVARTGTAFDRTRAGQGRVVKERGRCSIRRRGCRGRGCSSPCPRWSTGLLGAPPACITACRPGSMA